MEDAHEAVDNYGGNPKQAFFAVYDGHGGRGIVEFVSQHFSQILLEELAFDEDRSVAEEKFRMLQDSPYATAMLTANAEVMGGYGRYNLKHPI